MQVPIVFGGLRSLEADERVPVDQALAADDCTVDDGAIRGRNGYRNAAATAVGAGTPQGLWRHRPATGSGASAVRTIVARGGNIYSVSDPSSEIASDGAIATLGSVEWGAGSSSALVSAAQLGKYLYLMSDQASQNMIRVNPSFGIETLAPIPAGTLGAPTFTSLSTIRFKDLTGYAGANPAVSNATAAYNQYTDWSIFTNNNSGNLVTFDLTTNYNWAAYKWLAVMITPSTASGANNTVTISLIDNSGNSFQVGQIQDTPGNGAPNLIYCPLTGIPQANLAAIRKISFSSSNTGAYAVWGIMPVPQPPGLGSVSYYADFYNSTTKQSSGLFPAPPVSPSSIGGQVVTYTTPTSWPTFNGLQGYYNGWQNTSPGETTNPQALGNALYYNAGAAVAGPLAGELCELASFAITIPSGVAGILADTCRLWRVTSNGLRLCAPSLNSDGTVPTNLTAGMTSITLSDNQGLQVLAQQGYIQGGPPPACVAMDAWNGRLILGGDPSNPSRVSISSYLPFGSTGDPFPQWPPIAIDQVADGWSFDIAPAATEQVLAICGGDALYILTNQTCYAMSSVAANSPVFRLFARGTLGRRAAIWREGSLFWAGVDGIYEARGRSSVSELSASIRRLYQSWLKPGSDTVVRYQFRKLYIYSAGSGANRCLRYDFLTQTWTRHTLANGFQHGDMWHDPGSSYEQLWLLDSGGNAMRWQPGAFIGDTNAATSDAGSAIPAWNYSTGYSLTPYKERINFVYVDLSIVSGSLSVTSYKDAASEGNRSQSFSSSSEHELAWAPDLEGYKWRLALTAPNTAALRRLMWDKRPVSQRGG